jgi:magnesium transporter
LYALNSAETALLDQIPDIKAKILENFDIEDNASKYEHHDGYDVLYIRMPDELEDKNSFKYLKVYIDRNVVICIYEEWVTHSYVPGIIRASSRKGISPKKVMLSIVDAMLRDDFTVLGKIENVIDDLEDLLSTKEIETRIKEISSLRRKIRPMKLFYEHLIDAFEDLDENLSGLFNETELKYANRICGRIERLNKTVINLREYVIQVREAYQAQMDIGLQAIMKTFTVITVIFLPLNLLVGWYGMNLKMPEDNWEYGYLFVVSVAIFIIALCLFIFKWKKWY